MLTLHENAVLLEVDDAHLLEDLLHLPALSSAVVERVSDRAVILDPERADAVEAALIREGHLPQVL